MTTRSRCCSSDDDEDDNRGSGDHANGSGDNGRKEPLMRAFNMTSTSVTRLVTVMTIIPGSSFTGPKDGERFLSQKN